MPKKELLAKIKAYKKTFQPLSESELKTKAYQLKNKYLVEMDACLAEWFALVEEACFRYLGLQYSDSQLLGGICLNEGKIIEMGTGEGKTLTSVLPASLNSLKKKGAHIITTNEYLATRDQQALRGLYKNLALECMLVKKSSILKDKRKGYCADVTYISSSEIVFDFLRDSLAPTQEVKANPRLYFCLIDEIDSSLIDSEFTPIVIAKTGLPKEKGRLVLADKIVKYLSPGIHFIVDQKRKQLFLTPKGEKLISLFIGNFIYYILGDSFSNSVLNLLKAKYLMALNRDYIINNDNVFIIDKSNGRPLLGHRWSFGLHEAIEFKENIAGSGSSSSNLVETNNFSFFRLYSKLCGMTGTCHELKQQFLLHYDLQVATIPASKTQRRQDLKTILYPKISTKFKATIERIKCCFQKGQPIMVSTKDIEASISISSHLKLKGIPHQVLNSTLEDNEIENKVVEKAGKPFMVTVTTNIMGRGTDIPIGGSATFQLKKELQKIIKLNSNFRLKDLNQLKQTKSIEEYIKKLNKWEKNFLFVRNLKGLFVLGTEVQDQRATKQLRGRAGRGGLPGFFQVLASAEKLFEELKLSSAIPTRTFHTLTIFQNLAIEKELNSSPNFLSFTKPFNAAKTIFHAQENLASFKKTKAFILPALEIKKANKNEFWASFDLTICKANLYEKKGLRLIYRTNFYEYFHKNLQAITSYLRLLKAKPKIFIQTLFGNTIKKTYNI